MRMLPVLFLSLIPLATPLAAQDPGIAATIEGQMQAFRTGDVPGAFAFASPNIKGIFGTAENFGRMVEQGYPMVRNPGEIRLLELREVAGNLWQRVLVTDAAGRSHLLDYQMIETDSGWQINAVQLLLAPDVSA